MTPVPKPGSVPPAPVEPKDREDLPGHLQGRTRTPYLTVEVARALSLPRLWMADAQVATAVAKRGGPSWLELLAVKVARVVVAATTGSRAELRVELEATVELCATWADAVERRG